MTIAENLFVACLKDKDHKTLSKIQRRWLDGKEYREYKALTDYYRDNGEMMGVRTFCKKYALDPSETDSKPPFYLDAVRDRYLFSTLADKVPKLLSSLKENPREKFSDLQSLVASLAVDAVETRDVLYSDDAEERIKDYEERMKCLGVTYLSMGCDDMDKTFFGYRKGDLITIGGRAGAGKTWLIVYLSRLLEEVLVKKSELGSELGDALFISNEMGSDEIKERIDALKFNLPYKRFMEGTLSARDKKRYYEGLRSMGRSKIRILDGCQTIDELSTLMGLYRPSVVFLDGSYLMEARMTEGWEKIVYITRNLKRLAKSFGVPIINTTQLKRGTGKGGSKISLDGQDDFAYSSSYAQDSDIAIRMFQDADMKFHELVGLEVVKGRRVVTGTTLMFQNDLENMYHSITLPAEETTPPPEIKTDF